MQDWLQTNQLSLGNPHRRLESYSSASSGVAVASPITPTSECLPPVLHSTLDPDLGTELELNVYTRTVHDGGVNQGLCAESKMYIDDLRVKGGVILGRGWEVHDFFVSAQRCGCAVAPPGAAFCPGCMLFL